MIRANDHFGQVCGPQSKQDTLKPPQAALVVPVYIEVPQGFDRAVDTLESHLRRAGYIFHIGQPHRETLLDIKWALAEDHANGGKNEEVEETDN